MNIFFLIRSLDPGGAERQLVALANGMAERGHQVTLAVFYSGGELANDLDPAISQLDLQKTGRWDTLAFLGRLVREVKKTTPDILYAFLGTANLMSTLIKPFLKHIPVIWGVRASNMDMSHYGLVHQLHFKAECLFSRFTNAIITNSHAGAAYIKTCGYPTNKVKVIPNGIDTKTYSPSATTAKNGFTIGMVARIDPMKDHETFLRAAAMVAEKIPKATFRCVGRGAPDRIAELTALSTTLGIADRTFFQGEQRDMTDEYNKLDMVCLSSAFGEGFPNVLGEAMACAIPCVATNVGDAAQVIGNTGFTVPPACPEELAEAIIVLQNRMQSDPDLPAQCRQRIKTNFSIKNLIDATEKSLNRLIKE